MPRYYQKSEDQLILEEIKPWVFDSEGPAGLISKKPGAKTDNGQEFQSRFHAHPYEHVYIKSCIYKSTNYPYVHHSFGGTRILFKCFS